MVYYVSMTSSKPFCLFSYLFYHLVPIVVSETLRSLDRSLGPRRSTNDRDTLVPVQKISEIKGQRGGYFVSNINIEGPNNTP